MKVYIGLLLALILLISISTQLLYSQTEVVVKEVVTITVDKARVQTDVPPINVNGVTLVPVRGVFDAFNAEIGWFPVEKKVFIRNDSKVIWLQIGDAHAKVNDSIVPLKAPATIYRGRTMVSLRFIAEALGAKVDWNPDTQTITIITKGLPKNNEETPAETQDNENP